MRIHSHQPGGETCVCWPGLYGRHVCADCARTALGVAGHEVAWGEEGLCTIVLPCGRAQLRLAYL